MNAGITEQYVLYQSHTICGNIKLNHQVYQKSKQCTKVPVPFLFASFDGYITMTTGVVCTMTI
jgi:hypothetical protein